MDRDELHEKLEQDKLAAKNLIENLMQFSLFDEDGYPTEACLQIIQNWHWSDPRGYFDFIKSVWAYADWGWKEEDHPHRFRENETIRQYKISTAGWSGNESIIRAMQKNEMMWNLNWVQSRRGGHYIFEEYNVKE